MGRSGGRRWGLSVAAYGEIPMAAVIPFCVLLARGYDKYEMPAEPAV
jgi:hypothetical protein